eukprot:TRINITY_DN189_c0_g1_i4.p1 TRINITY_DN189_c0_g1~~TRINITY_DN189_c0_g1_i4.p1  ORF type:complete len:380 (-),score=78.49 TRINITY_DN189_c0_g1_i4:3-1112(-)
MIDVIFGTYGGKSKIEVVTKPMLPLDPVKFMAGNAISGLGIDLHGGKLVDAKYTCKNAFVACLHTAFTDHYAIRLSPDDIWLTIAQGFAIHVSKESKSPEMKKALGINWDGKIECVVRDDSLIMNCTTNDWTKVFDRFEKFTQSATNENTVNLLTPQFSTTTPISRVACQVALFDMYQHYISYMTMTRCGIPRIYLKGTSQDWKKLLTSAKTIASFPGLEDWKAVLLPVLKSILKSAELLDNGGSLKNEKELIYFWSSIYKFESISGGKSVTGWMNKLFPYTTQGKKLPNWTEFDEPGSYPPSFNSSAMIWDYLGKKYDMRLFSGHFGVSQDSDGVLAPAIGWMVLKEKKKKKYRLRGRSSETAKAHRG